MNPTLCREHFAELLREELELLAQLQRLLEFKVRQVLRSSLTNQLLMIVAKGVELLS